MWTGDFNLRTTDGVFDSRTDDGGMQFAAGTTIVGADMNAQNYGLPWTTEADLFQLNTNAQDATTTTRPGLHQFNSDCSKYLYLLIECNEKS